MGKKFESVPNRNFGTPFTTVEKLSGAFLKYNHRKETKMNKLIQDLIEKGMGNFMDRSRDALVWADEIYLNDIKDENELAQRYESLDLTKAQRKVINDYMACATTVNHRYADVSYMCGIKDTVSMLVSLGLIKGVDAEG